MRQKTAFLFAGQGAQFVGMGADFFRNKQGGIYDIMRQGPSEELTLTKNAQPAIFLHDLAAAEELQRRGVAADCAAGFSLGEIPALVFAGVLGRTDGFELVQTRAAAMQKCCEENLGMMVGVVKLTHEKVREIIAALGRDDIWAANFNSPALTVCSCKPDAVEPLSAAAAAAGGKGLRLRVSGAFHCPLMNDASAALRAYLANKKLNPARIPIYSNVTAKPYGSDYKELISIQIISPLLWQQTIENMLADGVRNFIEVGPGQELTGLVRRIVEAKGAEGIRIFTVGDMNSVDAVVKEIAK